jgi:diguanylate cyclase (GGDEF)-like protein
VCLVLVDLDTFKEVNDSRGHDQGDAVLQAVAYELRKQLRSFELIYRLGGEEFLIVLPGIDLKDGEILAERLRESIEEARPAGVPVTISIGVSAGSGEQVDYDTLFSAADAALYDSKRAGRNRVSAAPPATELDETDIPVVGLDASPAPVGPQRGFERDRAGPSAGSAGVRRRLLPSPGASAWSPAPHRDW